MPTKFRTPYTERKKVTRKFRLKSMTKQSMKDETNINNIMRKFEKNGVIAHLNEKQKQYGDYTEVQDYQASLNQVMHAQELFMELPATIRTRFSNDPGQFLSFVQDPKNQKELVDLGLATAPEPIQTEYVKGESTGKPVKANPNPGNQQAPVTPNPNSSAENPAT